MVRERVQMIRGVVAVCILMSLLCIAALAQSGQVIEFTEAVRAGWIEVRVCGTTSLGEVSVEVRNQESEALSILIVPGTVFLPGDSTVQRMGVTMPVTVSIAAGARERVLVAVACLDMALELPAGGFEFAGGIERLSEALLADICEMAEFQDASLRIRQFAVWTVMACPESRDDYWGLGLGFDVVATLEELGMPRELLILFYSAPDLVFTLNNEELATLEYAFTSAGVPVQGAEELYVLFYSGRPTQQELEFIGYLLGLAGCPIGEYPAVSASVGQDSGERAID